LANRHLERHGHEERIDHRSHVARGIDREPTIHLGYAANEMAARGAQSDRMDELRAIISRNDIRFDLRELEAELKGLEAERAAELSREDLRKRAGRYPDPHEWTERGGMVAQQGSANKWVKEAERDQDGISATGARKEWSQRKSPKKEGREVDERSDRDDERDR
jgi:hypothetical protein